MPTDNSPKTLRTTATLIAILKQLEAIDGARAPKTAEQMDKPKSTIRGHLMTLKQEQFVIKEDDFYFIDPELLQLGNQVRTREPAFVFARQFTERLLEEARPRSIFTVGMGGKAVLLHTASGSKMGQSHEQLGNRLFLHNIAVGRAIPAELPKSRIEQVLDRWSLSQETKNTTTDHGALFGRLERVREQGYAVNRAENFNELYAVGVAMTRRSGDVIGGFSVTDPAHSVTGEDRKAKLTYTVKDVISEFKLELALA